MSEEDERRLGVTDHARTATMEDLRQLEAAIGHMLETPGETETLEDPESNHEAFVGFVRARQQQQKRR